MTEPEMKPTELESPSLPAEPLRVYPEPPVYRWDFWAQEMLEQGLDRELVILGRTVMREAEGHGWEGLALRFADEHLVERVMTRSPQLARRLYELLLDTDGLRVAWVEDGEASDVVELPGFYCC